jgi:hypothetical protein
MIVSDAGPIIIFARIGRLSLLHEVTGSLTIPNPVHDEIVINKGGMPWRSRGRERRVDSAGGRHRSCDSRPVSARLARRRA